MSAGRIQSKHVPDYDVLHAVHRLRERSPFDKRWNWVLIWDLQKALPGVPYKVLLAKLRSLQRRGFVDGCFCGCRGDIELLVPLDPMPRERCA